MDRNKNVRIYKRIKYSRNNVRERSLTQCSRTDLRRVRLQLDRRNVHPRFFGKFAPSTRREDIVTDQALAYEIIDLFKEGKTVLASKKMTHGVRYINTYKNGNIIKVKKLTKIYIKDASPTITSVCIPRWKDTGPYLKSIAWLSPLIERNNDLYAFTLRLSDDVIQRAMKSQKGFPSFMRDRMQKALSKITDIRGDSGFEFFFHVEADEGSDPHLHGVIELPKGSDRVLYEAVRSALKSAGGVVRYTQLWMTPIYRDNPYGWIGYINKYQHQTAVALKGAIKGGYSPHLSCCTRNLNSLAKERYEKARETGGELLASYKVKT